MKRQRLGLLPLLMAGGGLVLAVVIAARLVSLDAISDLEASNGNIAEANRSLDLANRLELQVIELQAAQRGYLITGEPRFLLPRKGALLAIPRLERALLAAEPAQHRTDRATLRQLYGRIDRYANRYLPRVLALARSDPAAAQKLVAAGEGKRQVDAIRRGFSPFISAQERRQAQLRSEAEDSASSARTIAIAGLVLAPFLVAFLLVGAARGVVAPVRRLADSARRIREGDLEARAPEAGAGELRGLADGFNTMAESIQEGRDELESRNAELEARRQELQRTVGELAEEKERIASYQRFLARIAAPGSLDDLARVLLEQVSELGGADAAALYLRHDGTGEADLVDALGFERERLPQRLRAGEGLAGRALHEGHEVLASPSYDDGGASVQGFGEPRRVRHELHLPIGHDTTLGVVSLARLGDVPFEQRVVEDLGRMSEPAAVALANAVAHEQTEHAAKLNQAVLVSANDAYMATDEDGHIVEWTPRAEEMFGYAREEALGRPVVELTLPKELWPRFHGAVDQLLGGGTLEEPKRYETTAIRRDGRRFVVEVSPAAVRSRAGWVLTAFVRDIDERVQRRRERRATEAVSRVFAESKGGEEVLPRIVDALGEAMGWPTGSLWEWDPKAGALRSTYASRTPGLEAAAEAAEGLVHEVSDRPLEEAGVTAIERREIVWAPLDPKRLDDEALWALYEAGIKATIAIPVTVGDEPLVSLHYAMRSDEPPSELLLDGLQRIANLISQIVGRRRAEREAERLKDEFFALVSHELRTPLTSIIGNLDAVREGEVGEVNEEQARFLTVIDRNARRLMRLVGDLLFVAQVEAGKLSLERGDVELDVVVRECLEAGQPRARSGRVQLEVDAEPVELHEADRDRLGQLVDNLITNALKFTPKGGRVEVRLRRHGTSALLEVSDTGMGIQPEELERLFERFYRTPTATEAAVPGLGLGLSICKAIAEGHGGAISVESEIGAGTTFTVELPINQPAAKERARS